MSNKDDDKGYLIMGPELDNGARSAVRVNKDGVQAGEMYPPGTAPNYNDGTLTRIKTKPISGVFHEIVDEEPIGRPAMVNSKAYRNNWDNIFGNKQVVGNA
jgi:hypothetical protein